MSANPDRLTRRPPRSVPLILLAVLAVVVGGTGAWLVGAYLINGAWPAAAAGAMESIGTARFDAVPLQAAAAAVGLVGLLLLISALVPGDPARRAILEDTTPGQTAVSRRDLSRRVQRSVEHVDGVQSARVSLHRNRLDVLVRTPIEDTQTVQRRAGAAVEGAVSDLNPVRNPRPRIRIVRTD